MITLGLLGLLHIWDAFVTMFFLGKGLATELNPLMAALYLFGPNYFLSAKAFLVIWGSVILGFAWEHKGARQAAYIITGLYGLLGLYELGGLVYYWMNL